MYYDKEAPLRTFPLNSRCIDASVENGTADEIDLVLSHSRDEEHAGDEKDNPHTNLVRFESSSGEGFC